MKKFDKNNKDFIDFLQLWSFNAIYNFVDTVRNTGKTTKCKAWAIARYLKHGKQTLWLRAFDEDINMLKRDFISPKSGVYKILKQWGYNLTSENFEQEGRYIFYVDTKTKKRKGWIFQLCPLGAAQSLKGNEIVNCDLIVFDEYRLKPKKYSFYHGDMGKDFIDSVWSITRSHEARCILLGNLESAVNPIQDYFKIPVLPGDFEGYQTFKGGSIAVYQRLTVPDKIATSAYMQRQQQALAGTAIYDYLFDGEIYGHDVSQIAKIPKGAKYLYGIDNCGQKISVWRAGDKVYVRPGLDAGQHVWSFQHAPNYKYSARIMPGDKKHFPQIIRALANNSLYFTNTETAERGEAIFRKMKILSG